MNNLLQKSCKQLDSEPRGKQARVCITTFISTSLGKSLFFLQSPYYNFFLNFVFIKFCILTLRKATCEKGQKD